MNYSLINRLERVNYHLIINTLYSVLQIQLSPFYLFVWFTFWNKAYPHHNHRHHP